MLSLFGWKTITLQYLINPNAIDMKRQLLLMVMLIVSLCQYAAHDGPSLRRPISVRSHIIDYCPCRTAAFVF